MSKNRFPCGSYPWLLTLSRFSPFDRTGKSSASNIFRRGSPVVTQHWLVAPPSLQSHGKNFPLLIMWVVDDRQPRRHERWKESQPLRFALRVQIVALRLQRTWLAARGADSPHSALIIERVCDSQLRLNQLYVESLRSKFLFPRSPHVYPLFSSSASLSQSAALTTSTDSLLYSLVLSRSFPQLRGISHLRRVIGPHEWRASIADEFQVFSVKVLGVILSVFDSFQFLRVFCAHTTLGWLDCTQV